MKKCGFWKKALVYLSVMAMTPQSIVALGAELTAEALEPDADVLVRWIPEEDEIKTGEEGSITLEAELNTGRGAVGAAQVFISLTRQEAEAMLQFQDYLGEEGGKWEDGEETEAASSSQAEYIEEEEEIFPGYLEEDEEEAEDEDEEPEEEYFFEDKGEPFLISDKGDIPIRIEADEDDEEVRLVFVLNEENSYLRQKFQFSLPAGARELFDIDVTEDDISVVTAVPLPEEEEPDKKKEKPKKDKPKADPVPSVPAGPGGNGGASGGSGSGGSGSAGGNEEESGLPGESGGADGESGSGSSDTPGDSQDGEELPGTGEGGGEGEAPEEGNTPSDGTEDGSADQGDGTDHSGEEGGSGSEGEADGSGGNQVGGSGTWFFRKYPFSAFKHCHAYSIIIVVFLQEIIR